MKYEFNFNILVIYFFRNIKYIYSINNEKNRINEFKNKRQLCLFIMCLCYNSN